MIFDIFQSPNNVQEEHDDDCDLDTPLPLTTTTNPLVTQVTFDDDVIEPKGEQQWHHATTPAYPPRFPVSAHADRGKDISYTKGSVA